MNIKVNGIMLGLRLEPSSKYLHSAYFLANLNSSATAHDQYTSIKRTPHITQGQCCAYNITIKSIVRTKNTPRKVILARLYLAHNSYNALETPTMNISTHTVREEDPLLGRL